MVDEVVVAFATVQVVLSLQLEKELVVLRKRSLQKGHRSIEFAQGPFQGFVYILLGDCRVCYDVSASVDEITRPLRLVVFLPTRWEVLRPVVLASARDADEKGEF